MHLAISLDIAAANGQAVLDFSRISAFVRDVEAAGVDMVVISDSADKPSSSPFEATTLLAALAIVTDRIGLVAGASTLAHQPYNLARRFASLDIISRGRIGWNATLAQNPREAPNFSRPEGFSDEDFRRRAREFITIVRGLWVGWEPDALLFDKAGGRFHDPEKMQLLNHASEFFSVRGPLNVARSPQDRPVLVMSGLAEADHAFASRAADVILIGEQSPETAKTVCEELRRLARGADRQAPKLLLTVGAGSELGADQIAALHASSECDGINVALPADLSALDDFAGRVLPKLRGRGVAVAGHATLRRHLGLGGAQ
ncbi:LLM class flavin-dependent oxidoreductase [Mesorhizobium sp. CU2]|uniref:LLM class flavin-dependent oxidoreductase n=1 Tax=unclassified Mesorhizobium TaxID=325217 RepID=UPI00112AF256|nr:MULTISPECIES: LLM class flavin-dependent oxidoreductase [unclassified Mesorhizobium]TPN89886.1 LLM class flavin-dependent oxidoreductase [Mesorhizobium sp. CU3]TPO21492.1 LLM class flavin-dependent oxidoreductase [Mesorhizobium sp. CU2]